MSESAEEPWTSLGIVTVVNPQGWSGTDVNVILD